MLQSWQAMGNLNIFAAGFDVNEGTWPRISKWGTLSDAQDLSFTTASSV